MYDFYGNPPKTRQDIRDYLTSWLEKPDRPTNLEIEGETFVYESGFRRGFYCHSIYKSVSSDEYVWWVSEDCNIKTFPNKRFANYESLLESVINDYYKQWKLVD